MGRKLTGVVAPEDIRGGGVLVGTIIDVKTGLGRSVKLPIKVVGRGLLELNGTKKEETKLISELEFWLLGVAVVSDTKLTKTGLVAGRWDATIEVMNCNDVCVRRVV